MTTPIPSWLDPATEIKNPDQPEWFVKLSDRDKAAQMSTLCVEFFIKQQGMTSEQALEATANAISETGWFRHWRGNNMGGWKTNEPYVKEYKRIHGEQCPRWWRAPGHIASGDPPVVYYRGYDKVEDFLSAWVERFVPRGTSVPVTHRYYKTGKAFWAGSPSWFKELCLAGYKGPVTQANPGGSIAAFAQIIERARKIVAQSILGVTPDAAWGPSSAKALQSFLGSDGKVLDQESFNTICLKKFHPQP